MVVCALSLSGQVNTAFALTAPPSGSAGRPAGMLALAEQAASMPPYGTQLVAGCAWATWVTDCGNLSIYSNGSGFGNTGCGAPNACTFGPEFQCTELAQRYAYYAWGEPPTWDAYDGDGFASHMWNAAESLPVPLQQFANAQGVPPQRGDILIFGPGWLGNYYDYDGHVAVITDVTSTAVQIAEQNATPTGMDTLALNGSTITASGYTPVIGWLHNPAFGKPAPAVAAPPDGPQVVVWQGTGGHLWESTQSGTWSNPTDLTAEWKDAGLAGSAPSLAVTGNDALVAYWAGTDRDLWRATWSGGSWSAPVDVFKGAGIQGADLASAPTVALAPGGEQIVFWQDAAGSLWEAWTVAGAWYGPLDLTSVWGGGAILTSAPAAAVSPDGTQIVFWQGVGGHLLEAWYAGGSWYGPADWTSMMGLPDVESAPAVAVSPDGTQLVYWQGPGNGLNEIWYTGGWHGPVDWTATWGAAPLSSAPAVAVAWSGQEQLVFWADGSGDVSEAWWAGAVWHGPSEWTALRQPVSTPSVAVAPSGDQSVVWNGAGGRLMQAVESRGSWHAPSDLTATLSGQPVLAGSPSALTTPSGGRYVAWGEPDGHLWLDTGTQAAWGTPQDLTALWNGAAPLTGSPSLALDGNELLVFWPSSGGDLWQAWLSNGVWYGPVDWAARMSLPPVVGAPAAAVTPGGGTQLVFWEDPTGHLDEIWYAAGGWNGPVDWTARLALPALAAPPAVAVTPDGTQELVFWQGTGGNLWEAWWAGARWNGPIDWTVQWNDGGLLTSAPAATVTPDGSQQLVFWQGVDGDLWEAWWAGGQWNGPADWSALGPLN